MCGLQLKYIIFTISLISNYTLARDHLLYQRLRKYPYGKKWQRTLLPENKNGQHWSLYGKMHRRTFLNSNNYLPMGHIWNNMVSNKMHPYPYPRNRQQNYMNRIYRSGYYIPKPSMMFFVPNYKATHQNHHMPNVATEPQIKSIPIQLPLSVLYPIQKEVPNPPTKKSTPTSIYPTIFPVKVFSPKPHSTEREQQPHEDNERWNDLASMYSPMRNYFTIEDAITPFYKTTVTTTDANVGLSDYHEKVNSSATSIPLGPIWSDLKELPARQAHAYIKLSTRAPTTIRPKYMITETTPLGFSDSSIYTTDRFVRSYYPRIVVENTSSTQHFTPTVRHTPNSNISTTVWVPTLITPSEVMIMLAEHLNGTDTTIAETNETLDLHIAPTSKIKITRKRNKSKGNRFYKPLSINKRILSSAKPQLEPKLKQKKNSSSTFEDPPKDRLVTTKTNRKYMPKTRPTLAKTTVKEKPSRNHTQSTDKNKNKTLSLPKDYRRKKSYSSYLTHNRNRSTTKANKISEIMPEKTTKPSVPVFLPTVASVKTMATMATVANVVSVASKERRPTIASTLASAIMKINRGTIKRKHNAISNRPNTKPTPRIHTDRSVIKDRVVPNLLVTTVPELPLEVYFKKLRDL